MILNIAIFWAVITFIDLCVIILFSSLSNLTIKNIVYGFGFKLYQNQKWTIRLLPIRHSVKFKDRIGNKVIQTQDFFEDEARISKIFLALSGSVMLLLLSWFILGNSVLSDFFPWMARIFLAPFTASQEKFIYFDLAFQYIQTHSALLVFAKTCFFFSVFNLIPMPNLPGGRFIIEFVRNKKIFDKIFLCSFAYWIVMLFSWFYALLKYLFVY